MRSAARCLALLPLLLLAVAVPAHADPMDNFTITGGGQTIDFSLPASTTGEFEVPIGQDNFGQVSGTVNSVSELVFVNVITGVGCAECQSILLGDAQASFTIALPNPPLYQLTPGGALGETLTFIPGTYMTGGYNDSQPFGILPFEINIAPDTAATPEPPTLILSAFAAASLCGLLLMKRRALA